MVEPAKPRIKASDLDLYLEVHNDWIQTLVKMRKTGQIKEQQLEEMMPEAFLKVLEVITKVLKENKINEQQQIAHDREE